MKGASTSMKCAVLVFPGSTCDTDLYHALRDTLGCAVELVWHDTKSLAGFDAIAVPGGFSYGDYIRCGAVAALSDCIPALKEAAAAGVPILGIGNGFQILTEIGLLPGAFLRNQDMEFICDTVQLTVENNSTRFTGAYEQGETITLPIAHHTGRYYADEKTLQTLRAQNRIVFTYQDNPNGSLADIAGILNESGNVLGMMPHPERAVECLLGSEDGRGLFQSILNAWREGL